MTAPRFQRVTVLPPLDDDGRREQRAAVAEEAAWGLMLSGALALAKSRGASPKVAAARRLLVRLDLAGGDAIVPKETLAGPDGVPLEGMALAEAAIQVDDGEILREILESGKPGPRLEVALHLAAVDVLREFARGDWPQGKSRARERLDSLGVLPPDAKDAEEGALAKRARVRRALVAAVQKLGPKAPRPDVVGAVHFAAALVADELKAAVRDGALLQEGPGDASGPHLYSLPERTTS